MAKKKRTGPPVKAPGGLGEVLYVRVTRGMLDALDARAAQWRGETGLPVSRADVARKILADALAAGAT